MKNLVLNLLSILVPTPCANLNISFAFAMDHLCPLLQFRRAGSLSMRQVAGLTAAPENREVWWWYWAGCAGVVYRV